MDDNVIGTGAVGSTAKGLDLLRGLLGKLELADDAEVTVEVPASIVVAADVFDAFLERNQFGPADLVGLSDRQIIRRFLDGELPSGIRDELAQVPHHLDGPLVVRPSSVLEESLERSLGAVYSAKLIPNLTDDPNQRLRQLVEAVKLVWASTFSSDAVNWRRGAGESVDAERMAVVIQRAVGMRHGDRFYPTMSAVARSYNHYPVPGDAPEEGVVTLALGFGRIMSEVHCWSYCPERPTAPPPFKSMGDLLKYTQTSFWALDLSGEGGPDPVREDEHLVRLGLGDAERDGTLEMIASTYDAESDRLRAGFDGDGPRAVTFAPMLRSRAIPVASVIADIVASARESTGHEVEVEVAASLHREAGVPARIGLVQLKTIPGPSDQENLSADDLSAPGVVLASEACLGDGCRDDIVDIVYLKPAAFDRNQTRPMASELDAVNRELLEEGRPALLVGFGRWGTTDERYGVPVRWGQISSAEVIVEVALAEAPLQVSQGTHFFHHLVSQRVLYFAVEHDGRTAADLEWLDALEPEWEGRYVRHVRLERPVEVQVDGSSRRGLIRWVEA
jgi:hypothetical protein